MADRSKSSVSKTNSARRPASSSGRRPASGVKNTNIQPNRDLLSKEEEYKRLNEELESRTANLVREAEELMKEQESVLSKPSLLDNINTEDFLNEWGNDVSLEESGSRAASRSASKVSNNARPQSRTKRPPSSRARTKSATKSNLGRNIADDVAMPDEAFLTDFKDFSFRDTIANMEGQVDERGMVDDDYDDDDTDVMPSAAAEMGAEAQIRFLKAKLRVMQEELDRLAQECTKKDEDNNTLLARVKELEEERNRLSRTGTSQQQQIDKYRKLSEDAKEQADSLEIQLSGLRKELETTRRSAKQQVSNQGVTEVRLNRALEEVEKYKSQLQHAKQSKKESADSEKRKLDQLLADNKRLEKQKNELMTGFKKQLKLIDVLKRQKMHIEAAKMLSFTEEEFVKALEWGN